MSTFTTTASALGHTKQQSSSSWNSGKAYQGQYGGNSGSRVGAILFSNLRSIAWAEQTISQITLRLTYSQAGTLKSKTLSMYQGTKNSLTGTGSAMIGTAIGTASTNGNAYGSTTTITFNASSNANAFARLVNFLQNGSSTSLVLYNGETISGSSGWTSNYLCVTAATMTVTYELSGSGGTVTPNPINAGNTATLNISPISVSGTLTHTVQWKMGTASSNVSTLDSGVTSATYAIPTNWASQITSGLSGTATCVLTTYVDGNVRGSRNIEFTVNLPTSEYPTFDYTISSSEGSSYYQYISKASIAIKNATGQSGATIASYRITGTEGVSSASSSVTTPTFASAGTHTYVLSVTDSRGATTTKSVSINVISVSSPTVSNFSVRRYGTRINDQAETEYYETTSGGHVWVTISATIDSAGGNNNVNAYILYGSAEGSLTNRANLSWSGTSYSTTNNRDLISATIPLDGAYAFELHISDAHYSATAFTRVEASWAPLHIAGTGYGVAFGMYSDGTKTDPKVQSAWPIYAGGGIYGADGNRIDGQELISSGSATITSFGSNFEAYYSGNNPKVVRYGNIVQLNGVCKPTSTIGGSSTSYEMFTIPSGYRPMETVYQICQGSNTTIWLLTVESSGVAYLARMRNGSEYATASTSFWLPIQAMWITNESL